MNLDFILWTPSPEMFSLGAVTVRWYGLLFASGFLIGQYILAHIFAKEGKPEEDINAVTMYMVIATVLGARLGHCFFYEPDYFLAHPIEIFKVWNGGLASHGATIGIIAALYFYSRNRKGQSFLWILDRIVIVVALGGALIRMGNLMNSEIVGRPSNSPVAFVFGYGGKDVLEQHFGQVVQEVGIKKSSISQAYANAQGIELKPLTLSVQFKEGVSQAQAQEVVSQIPQVLAAYEASREDIQVESNPKVEFGQAGTATVANVEAYGVPRLPSQLFEAISTFLLFVFLYLIWNKKKAQTPEGSIFGLFVVILFSLRFIYEFYKENQVAFEDKMPLNMGQILSLPMIAVGLLVLYMAYAGKTKPKAE